MEQEAGLFFSRYAYYTAVVLRVNSSIGWMATPTNTTYKSVRELARELGIGVTVCYRSLGDGTIPAIRLGKRYVISREAVRRWLLEAGGKLPGAVA